MNSVLDLIPLSVVDTTARPPQMPAVELDATAEIALDQLRAGDQILIHTLHSTYIFLILDPAKQLGQVVGGVFGDYAIEVLLDTMPVAHDHRLRAGMRVLFLAAGSRGKRVTTSVIKRLVHRPAEMRATR